MNEFVRIIGDGESLEQFMQRNDPIPPPQPSAQPPAQPVQSPDDLIPLAPIGFSTGTGLDPVEPVRRQGGVRVQRQNDGKWRYIFHPEQEYGDNWLHQHELAYASYMRNAIVDFARSVAGHFDRELSDFLHTGFEDITDLMRDALNRNNRSFQQSTGGPHISPDEERIGAVRDETVQELSMLTKQVRAGEISPRDLEVFMQNMRQEQAQHEYYSVRFSTLPYNLRRFYFKNVLKTAVENAISDVITIARLPRTQNTPAQLFSALISGDKRTDFVRLVAQHVKLAFFDASNYGRTVSMRKQLVNDREDMVTEFLRYRPDLPSSIESSQSSSFLPV